MLRSDVYEIGADFALTQIAADVPYVELDADHYQVVGEFDKRFPRGCAVAGEGLLAEGRG